MSALHVLALVGAIFTSVLLLGLTFLGFLVVMKVIMFARGAKEADRARAIALAVKEKADADRDSEVPAP